MSLSDSYDQFWRASAYSPYNLAELARQQDAFNGQQKQASILTYPQKPLPLPVQKRHPLRNIENRRKSIRTFTGTRLTTADLSNILSSFRSTSDLEHRTYPSAGAMYGLEIFCVTYDVENFTNKLLYYNPDHHAISVVGDAPSWDEASNNCNIDTDGSPQCIILFVSLPERLTAKYGERGGRFALIECGAALQQLTMHVASSKSLAGCPVGGLIDAYWLRQLNLSETSHQVMLGYVCGKASKNQQ
jgi:SagB-type dehydrogenase family enzyme